MIKYQGIGVCNAIAIGKVSLLQRQNREILPHRVDEIETEIERLERARGTALDQLKDIQKKAEVIVGDRDAELFEFYGMILNDDSYQDSIRTLIKEEHVNAEYAVFSMPPCWRPWRIPICKQDPQTSRTSPTV